MVSPLPDMFYTLRICASLLCSKESNCIQRGTLLCSPLYLQHSPWRSINICCYLPSFFWTAGSKEHRPEGLNNMCYVLTLLRLDPQDQVPAPLGFVENFLWVTGGQALVVSSRGGQRSSLPVSSWKSTNPIMKSLPS